MLTAATVSCNDRMPNKHFFFNIKGRSDFSLTNPTVSRVLEECLHTHPGVKRVATHDFTAISTPEHILSLLIEVVTPEASQTIERSIKNAVTTTSYVHPIVHGRNLKCVKEHIRNLHDLPHSTPAARGAKKWCSTLAKAIARDLANPVAVSHSLRYTLRRDMFRLIEIELAIEAEFGI